MEHEIDNSLNKRKKIDVLGSDRSDSPTEQFSTRKNRDITRRVKSPNTKANTEYSVVLLHAEEYN